MTLRTLELIAAATVVLTGCSGSQGQKGDKGDKGDPGGNLNGSISGVFPNTVVLGREFDAIVVGSSTTFDSSTTLDFGPGITTSSIRLASPTALFVHLQIDKAAAVGLRDLRVGGNAPGTAAQILSIIPGLEVTVRRGTEAQGSVAEIDVINNDRTAFEPSSGESNVSFKLQGGVHVLDNPFTTPGAARFVVAFDPLAPPGPSQTQGVNQFYDYSSGTYVPLTTFYSAPNAFTIAPRTPTSIALDGSTSPSYQLANPLDNRLFKATTNGTAQFVTLTFQGAPNTPISPCAYGIPSSGKFLDILYTSCGYSNQPTPVPAKLVFPAEATPTTFYVDLIDSERRGTSSGYGFVAKGTGNADLGTAVAEQGAPHSTYATSQVINPNQKNIISGTIGTAAETDLYKVGTINGNYELTLIADGDVCITVLQQSDTSCVGKCCGRQLGTGGEHGYYSVGSFNCSGNPCHIQVVGREGATRPTGHYVLGWRPAP